MNIAMRAANAAVDRIVTTMKQRRGLRQAWESIDEETQQEIIAVWRGIVRNEVEDVTRRISHERVEHP